MRNEVATFLLALQFLTRIPVPSADIYTEERMAASVRYYPLVGGVLGVLIGAVYWLAHMIWPQAVAVVFAMCAGMLLTGAFHEDGLADTFDGLGGGQTRERALEIMRDSRLGTYGTLALIGALALKFSSLFVLSAGLVVLAFIAGHGLSRFSSLVVLATSAYVRAEGTGKPVARGLSGASLAVSVFTVIAIVVLWCLFASPMLLLAGCCGLVMGHILMRAFFERKLGGYTGDTLGAVQQASEAGFYLGVVAWV